MDSFFIKALQEDQVVFIKGNGLWKCYPFWMPRRLRLQIKRYMTLLDQCERIPLLLDKSSRKHPKVLTIQSRYLDGAIALESYLLRHQFSKNSSLFHRFKLKVISLLYRLEEIVPTDPDLSLYQQLLSEAKKWKQNEKSFWRTAISFQEEIILQRCCGFSYYVGEVLKNKKSLNELFKWVLRDKMPIEVWVKFPAMAALLHRALMVGRISRMGGAPLKISEIPQGDNSDLVEVTLTLPFEGKEVNILDPHKKVKFKGDYTLSIQEIFAVFANKKYAAGNLEFLQEGIVNWNTFKLAYWSAPEKHYVAIDLLRPEWWKQLPSFETLSLSKARERYGPQLDGENWNFSIRASREDHSLDFDRSHSYLEVAIPIDKTSYQIYDFGKFATWFPKDEWDRMWNFSVFSPAVIAYPDENVFYTHRQHVNFSHLTTAEEGGKIMESIKNDMIEARKGNLVFQIESENCGKWIYGVLSPHLGAERVPNHYLLPLVETEPKGVVKWIFNTLKKLPKKIQVKILAYLHLPFGAWKGVSLKNESGETVHRNLIKSDFWKDTVVYLPAMLHHKYEQEHNSQAIEVRIPTSRR